VRVDTERNVILVKGAVPGHAGANVIVHRARRSRQKAH
jgi:ribosomal protein L3